MLLYRTCSMFLKAHNGCAGSTDLQNTMKLFARTDTYTVNTCNVTPGVFPVAFAELRQHNISVCIISVNWT